VNADLPELPDQPVPPGRPTLRIVRGNPDDCEVAALVAVVTRMAATDGEPPGPPQPQTLWGAPRTMVREVVEVTGWWEHGLPR
jgi:hypothetical protein